MSYDEYMALEELADEFSYDVEDLYDDESLVADLLFERNEAEL